MNEKKENHQEEKKDSFAGKFVKWLGHGKDGNERLKWRDNEDTLARIIPSEFMASQLFFRRKLNVHPGETALILHKGKVTKIIEEGQVVSSGVIDRFKKTCGAGEDLVLMMIDSGEFLLKMTSGIEKNSLLFKDPLFYKKILNTLKSKAVSSRIVDLEDVNKKSHGQHTDKDEIKEKIQFHEAEFKFLFEENKNKEGEQKQEEMLKTMMGLKFDKEKETPLLTKDREPIALDVRIRLNFLPQKAEELFKLVNREKSGQLQTGILENLISQELSVRVFAPKLLQHTAEELRKNVEIIGQLQQDAQKEIFSWLANYGIQVNQLSVNPAITDNEIVAVKEKEQKALEEIAKNQHERNKAEAEREYELLLMRDQFARDFKRAEEEKDLEILAITSAILFKKNENELSKAEIKAKIDEVELQIEYKKQELKLLGLDREWGIEKDRMVTEAEIDTTKMQALAEEHRKNKAQKTNLQLEQMRLAHEIAKDEQGHMVDVLKIGAEAKKLTPEVLVEIARQTTIRKALDRSDIASQAFANAEAQKHSKENFREGISNQPPIGIAGKGAIYLQQGGQIPSIGNPLNENDHGHIIDEQITCAVCNKSIPYDSEQCPYCKTKVEEKL
jgi:hypothetical protein